MGNRYAGWERVYRIINACKPLLIHKHTTVQKEPHLPL